MHKTLWVTALSLCEKIRAWIRILAVSTYFQPQRNNVISWNVLLPITFLFPPSCLHAYSILTGFLSSGLIVIFFFFVFFFLPSFFFFFPNMLPFFFCLKMFQVPLKKHFKSFQYQQEYGPRFLSFQATFPGQPSSRLWGVLTLDCDVMQVKWGIDGSLFSNLCTCLLPVSCSGLWQAFQAPFTTTFLLTKIPLF